MMTHQAALLIVDVQNDFCAGGALAVGGADRVVTALNRYLEEARSVGLTIYASRDWHPATSRHFQPFGGEWPVHCVVDTPGAHFHPDIRLPSTVIVITKGEDPSSAGYSAFEGHTPEGTTLLGDLKARGIGRLYVGGLATDFCVRQSVLDALSRGLEVTLLEDAIAGVTADGSANALAEMRQRGAQVAIPPRLVSSRLD